MIDIHSHIIFGVDDGPKNENETRLLLEESYRQGVRGIIATSHRRKGMFETPESTIRENFRKVKEIASQVASDLSVFYGAEIYFTEDVLQKLEKKEFPSLHLTDFVLVEFSSNTAYQKIYQSLTSLIRLGFIPVVAHIERYDAFENDIQKVESLIEMGCFIQINSSSVLKPKLFGDAHKIYKKRAQLYLDKNLVHFVASDMHNLENRPPYMQEAYQLICAKYGEDRAQDLFYTNAHKLLQNKSY